MYRFSLNIEKILSHILHLSILLDDFPHYPEVYFIISTRAVVIGLLGIASWKGFET